MDNNFVNIECPNCHRESREEDLKFVYFYKERTNKSFIDINTVYAFATEKSRDNFLLVLEDLIDDFGGRKIFCLCQCNEGYRTHVVIGKY